MMWQKLELRRVRARWSIGRRRRWRLMIWKKLELRRARRRTSRLRWRWRMMAKKLMLRCEIAVLRNYTDASSSVARQPS